MGRDGRVGSICRVPTAAAAGSLDASVDPRPRYINSHSLERTQRPAHAQVPRTSTVRAGI